MSQATIGTIDPSTESGSALATRLNNFGAAVNTLHSGSSRPSYAVAGTMWLDTTTTAAWALKVYDGTSDITIATFNASTHAAIGYRLKRIRSFTSSATYTPTDANVKAIFVQVQGAGGGGGGAAAASTGTASAGGGGSAGTYSEGLITSGFSSVAMTIGAGGAGASAGNNNGSNGGSTSFASLIVAPGGNGGGGANSSSTPAFGGTPGAISSAPTIDSGVQSAVTHLGQPGNYGIRLGTEAISGAGSPSHMGTGGISRGTSSSIGAVTGSAASGYGGGGSGGGSANAAAAAGGAGGDGIIRVWEYE